MRFSVEHQGPMFQLPGREDGIPNLRWVGTIEADTPSEAIAMAKEAGLSCAPIVYPAGLSDDERMEMAQLLAAVNTNDVTQ